MKTDTCKPRPFTRKIVNEQQQEFNAIVGEMLLSHPKSQISFNEFMMLLGKFDIKFYSPEEFKKISKIFNNTFHILPTATPFEYLQLHTKQLAGPHTYYLVRVLHKKVDVYSNDAAKLRIAHPVEKCMGDFVVLMRKRYGNEINWFKVLGGMTVAISIEADIFRSNLTQIMRNTSHHRCIEEIMSLFLEPHSKIVTWKQFMAIIKTHIKKFTQDVWSKSKKSFHLHHQKVMTEPSEGYLTVKSNFFNSQKTKIDEKSNCKSLRRENQYSKSVYGTKHWQSETKFFGSRCRTEGAEEVDLKISMQKCPIYSKTKTSVSFAEGRDTVYPMKKHTISLPINEKRIQRNHFLWRYLKEKLQQH